MAEKDPARKMITRPEELGTFDFSRRSRRVLPPAKRQRSFLDIQSNQTICSPRMIAQENGCSIKEEQ